MAQDQDFEIADGVLESYKGKDSQVVIPEGVTEIGEGAFYCCTSLASVTIPEGVTAIGSDAFKGCTSRASVTIPEGVKEIGICAFERCTSLASVTIPESVTKIGSDAFMGCTSLKEIHYAGTKAQWKAVEKGRGWKRDSAITSIICSDGKVKA